MAARKVKVRSKKAAIEWIAKRQFVESESGQRVTARIAMPQQINPAWWVCRVEFREGRTVEKAEAYGIDSLQALILAIQAMRLHADERPRKLHVLGGAPGELGIDRSIPGSLGTTLRTKFENLLDATLRSQERRRIKADSASKRSPAAAKKATKKRR